MSQFSNCILFETKINIEINNEHLEIVAKYIIQAFHVDCKHVIKNIILFRYFLHISKNFDVVRVNLYQISLGAGIYIEWKCHFICRNIHKYRVATAIILFLYMLICCVISCMSMCKLLYGSIKEHSYFQKSYSNITNISN